MIVLLIAVGFAPAAAGEPVANANAAAGRVMRHCIGDPVPYPDVCATQAAGATVLFATRTVADGQAAAGEAEQTAAFAQAVAERNVGLALLLATRTADETQATAEQEAADTERYIQRNIDLAIVAVERQQAEAEALAAAAMIFAGQTAEAAGDAAESAPGDAEAAAQQASQDAAQAFAEAYCSELGKTPMNQGGDCIDAALTFLAPYTGNVANYAGQVGNWGSNYQPRLSLWVRCAAVDPTGCGFPPGGFPFPIGSPV